MKYSAEGSGVKLHAQAVVDTLLIFAAATMLMAFGAAVSLLIQGVASI